MLLVTRPNYDPGTNYLFYWSQAVIDFAKRKSIGVLDLSGNKASRIVFESYISKNNPKVVFFNGHGSNRAIAGNNGEPIVEAGENEGLLRGKIVYTRCCNAAALLGLLAVKKGASAFMGYKKSYVFATLNSCVTRPLTDIVAKLFLEASNLIPISLLKGNTVQEADRKSKRAMNTNLRFMLSGAATQAQKDAAPHMWNNITCQVVLGDGSAKM